MFGGPNVARIGGREGMRGAVITALTGANPRSGPLPGTPRIAIREVAASCKLLILIFASEFVARRARNACRLADVGTITGAMRLRIPEIGTAFPFSAGWKPIDRMHERGVLAAILLPLNSSLRPS